MNRKAKSVYASMLVIAASCASWAYAGELVKGRVVDIGLPDLANGIGGVSVVISEETTQKTLGDGITDATGTYQIELKTPHAAKLVAKFSKIGYFSHPTLQPVATRAQTQPSVKLSRESGSEAYYKMAADNIFAAYKLNRNVPDTSFSAVTALSTTEKEKVFNALKLKDSDAYKSLKNADQIYRATQEFVSKQKNMDGSTDNPFNAYANYGNNGTVRLYGAVRNADSKREFETAMKSLPAVRNVQNDLVIVK